MVQLERNKRLTKMAKLPSMSSSRKRVAVVFVLVLFCVGFVVNAGYMQGVISAVKEYVQPMSESVTFRRDIADQLLEIVQELRGYNVSHHIPLKLISLAAQLDARYKLSSLEVNSLGAKMQSNPVDDADTCREVYTDRKTRLESLFERELVLDPECSEMKRNTPISDLVTILLVTNGQYLLSVLQGIRKYHEKLPVILAYNNPEDIKGIEKFESVTAMQFKTNYSGIIWNKMVQKVSTPYVFIGRDLSHFTEYVFLERLVHSLAKSSPVGVSSGATRNLTGHWKLGCHQTEVKNYFLRFAEGYKYSTEDCIFCDHLSGPFMAKSSVMRQIPFSEKLPGHVLLEDWFLKVRRANVLAINCPDVMFFVQTHSDDVSLKKNFRESWLGLAMEWQFTRIFVPPDTHFMFTCEELSLNCDSWIWGRKYYLIPTCCLEQVAKTIREIEAFATEMGMTYELDSGSQLSALKLQGHSPWDLDGDIRYDKKFYDDFKKHRQRFSQKNIVLEFIPERKKFKVFTPDIYIEMWDETIIGKKFLPEDVQNIPTKMSVLGVWVRGAPNPGLYTRNNYGPHHFKHAVFYSFNNNGETDDYNYAGSWLPCSQRSFHGCLDMYSPDGSLHFTPHYFGNLGLAWDKGDTAA